MVKKKFTIAAIIIFWAVPAAAAEFTLSFEWGDIPLCTTGHPNTVPNPKFVLSNIPAGTKFIQFKLTDLDVPSYDHGGGIVAYTGTDTIEPGAFEYKSPCPPSGSHRYRWTATAKAKTGFFSGSLGKAQVTRTYP
jgi:phosphatidylethanolamine-binding protein (PEBP) family uncharacterized protein